MQISIKCYFDQQCSACHMPVHGDEIPVTSQAAGRQRRRPRQHFSSLLGQIQLQRDTQTEDSAALFKRSAVRENVRPNAHTQK